MQDKDLYAQILGIQRPWVVRAVDLDLPGGEVVVHVQHDHQVALCCPECGAEAPGYDSRERRWRHLDTCQYRTILSAEVPRCNCPEHGVRQVAVHIRGAALEAELTDYLGNEKRSPDGHGTGNSRNGKTRKRLPTT